GPYNVQRLPNGNTFVAANGRLLEFDAAARKVFEREIEPSVAANKLPDGQMVYLTSKGQCVRLDVAGKEVKRFESGQNNHSGCVLDLTPRGSLLVSRCSRSNAAEFDLEGNQLWEAGGEGFGGIPTATRDGHLVVAIYSQSRVVQVDRSGRVVWQCQTP